MAEWQPIKTAPKDGRVLWLYWPDAGPFDQQQPGYWQDDEVGWINHADSMEFDQPTHWMPLPEPPAGEGRNG